VALVADSGAIYALYDADDKHHKRVVAAVANEPAPIIVPAAILAELDYLLVTFLGVDAELDFLDGVFQGIYTIAQFDARDISYCKAVIAKYRDLELGLADSSVMATAERLNINRILTLDVRHFRAVKPQKWKAFNLLPD
jgi:uncharacterized protein